MQNQQVDSRLLQTVVDVLNEHISVKSQTSVEISGLTFSIQNENCENCVELPLVRMFALFDDPSFNKKIDWKWVKAEVKRRKLDWDNQDATTEALAQLDTLAQSFVDDGVPASYGALCFALFAMNPQYVPDVFRGKVEAALENMVKLEATN